MRLWFQDCTASYTLWGVERKYDGIDVSIKKASVLYLTLVSNNMVPMCDRNVYQQGTIGS